MSPRGVLPLNSRAEGGSCFLHFSPSKAYFSGESLYKRRLLTFYIIYSIIYIGINGRTKEGYHMAEKTKVRNHAWLRAITRNLGAFIGGTLIYVGAHMDAVGIVFCFLGLLVALLVNSSCDEWMRKEQGSFI